MFGLTVGLSLTCLLIQTALHCRAVTGGPFERSFAIFGTIALYVLVFRLVHPGLIRRLARVRRMPFPPTAFIPRGFVRWYLGTGTESDLPGYLRDTPADAPRKGHGY
jgi:hypothetical protein